jgi:energy-coupling factor transport system ATP-binding protein
VGLAGLERKEPHLLSGGQKQRLAIAAALAMSPSYLVMDEPTAMLDRRGRADVLAVLGRLREAGHAIVHVTHHVGDIAGADRVLVLEAGRVVFDGTPELLLGANQLFGRGALELPSIAVLGARLRAAGYEVPELAMTPESVVSALWP